MAPVRLYYICNNGATRTIQCDVDEVLSEGEYFSRWANAFDLSAAYAKTQVTAPMRVFTTDHADSVYTIMCVESPRDSMRRAVKHMPEGAPYAVLFVGAANWNNTQFTIAHKIVEEQHMLAAEARVVALEAKLAAAKSTTTKKPVRVYMCVAGTDGPVAMVEYQPDEVAVDNELVKTAFKRRLPSVSSDWFFVSTITVPGEEHGVNHYDDLHKRPGFAGALNRAITLAACCCPDRAPYSIAFLRGYGTPSATQIVKEWRASFSGKYMAPQPGATTPAPVDPLMEWYTLNKQAKAANEALLAKLKEALTEKAKDPVLNPTGARFDDTAESLLEVLSASTDNIALIGASVRYAAYEACGIRFGPVLAASPLRLSTLDAVSTLPWQVRMTDLPWASNEQK